MFGSKREQFIDKIRGWQDFLTFCAKTTGQSIDRDSVTQVMAAIEVFATEHQLIFKLIYDHLDKIWASSFVTEEGVILSMRQDPEPINAIAYSVLCAAKILEDANKLRK